MDTVVIMAMILDFDSEQGLNAVPIYLNSSWSHSSANYTGVEIIAKNCNMTAPSHVGTLQSTSQKFTVFNARQPIGRSLD